MKMEEFFCNAKKAFAVKIPLNICKNVYFCKNGKSYL